MFFEYVVFTNLDVNLFTVWIIIVSEKKQAWRRRQNLKLKRGVYYILIRTMQKSIMSVNSDVKCHRQNRIEQYSFNEIFSTLLPVVEVN